MSIKTRAGRSFWLLLVVALVAAGVLSSALTSPPSPITGLRVAGSGIVLLVAITLEVRVMAAIGRSRRNRGAKSTAGQDTS